MSGRIVRFALILLLAGLIVHPTAWAAGAARHLRPNVPVLGWYTDTAADLASDPLAGYRNGGMSVVVAAATGDDTRDAAFLEHAAAAGVRVLFEPNATWVRNGD